MTQYQTPTQIVLAARPDGRPKPGDFRLEKMILPDLQDGQVLLATQYLSLDPYMRGRMDDRRSYAPPTALGDVMEGETISKVVQSRHPEFKENDLVLARSGWCTHRVTDGRHLTLLDP